MRCKSTDVMLEDSILGWNRGRKSRRRQWRRKLQLALKRSSRRESSDERLLHRVYLFNGLKTAIWTSVWLVPASLLLTIVHRGR